MLHSSRSRDSGEYLLNTVCSQCNNDPNISGEESAHLRRQMQSLPLSKPRREQPQGVEEPCGLPLFFTVLVPPACVMCAHRTSPSSRKDFRPMTLLSLWPRTETTLLCWYGDTAWNDDLPVLIEATIKKDCTCVVQSRQRINTVATKRSDKNRESTPHLWVVHSCSFHQ